MGSQSHSLTNLIPVYDEQAFIYLFVLCLVMAVFKIQSQRLCRQLCLQKLHPGTNRHPLSVYLGNFGLQKFTFSNTQQVLAGNYLSGDRIRKSNRIINRKHRILSQFTTAQHICLMSSTNVGSPSGRFSESFLVKTLFPLLELNMQHFNILDFSTATVDLLILRRLK